MGKIVIDYLIYGGSGFIGSNLRNDLSKNYKVKTLGRSISSDFQTDDPELLAKVDCYHFDTIIHCSGITHNPNHANFINNKLIEEDIEITTKLLKILNEISWGSLIYLSSIAIYGLKKGRNISLGQDISLVNGYSLARFKSENILLNHSKSKSISILRLPLVFGTEAKGNLRLLNKLFQLPIVFLPSNGGTKSYVTINKIKESIENRPSNKIIQLKTEDASFTSLALMQNPSYSGKIVLINDKVMQLLLFPVRLFLPQFVNKIFNDFTIINDERARKV